MPTTSNFGWTTPADTDLVKDGAAAIRTLGNGIDTSLVDLKGGTTGQILSKNSNTDLDYIWINNDQGDITAVTAGTGLTGGGTTGAVTLTNDMATTITAAGDIVVGTGSGTYDNLPIGTTGQVLTADTTVSPYKVKWAAPSGGDFVRITSQSFSAAATVNVNDVFSSTYKNYKIFINLAHSTGTVNFFCRWRVSGADNTTSNYSYQRITASSTTLASARSTAEDKHTLPDIGTDNSNIELTVFSPFASRPSYIWSEGNLSQSNPTLQMWANSFNGTTSFTGITFYVSSGTITGSVEVYGIKDA